MLEIKNKFFNSEPMKQLTNAFNQDQKFFKTFPTQFQTIFKIYISG